MKHFRPLLRRLRALFRRDALDREMDDEMRFHLEMQARENTETGVPGEEAEHLARRQFGPMDGVKEAVRERRGIAWLENLWRDFRFAGRSLCRSPGYALAVATTLAIGIGSATAIVSVARHVIFPRIPFPQSEQLYTLDDYLLPRGYRMDVHELRFRAYHQVADAFDALAAQRIEPANLVIDGEPRPLQAARVSEDYFDVFRVKPELGRYLVSDDFRPDRNAVVLSHELWRKRFNSDPDVLGQVLLIGGEFRNVVGVAAADFKSPLGFKTIDLFLPLPIQPGPHKTPTAENVDGIGRLKPGVSVAQAQAELATMQMPDLSMLPRGKRLGLERLSSSMEPRLTPLRDHYQTDTGRLFWIFLGAVGFLYAISCVNAGNLMLSRTLGRQRELGVRLALGGGHARVIRFLMTENVLLSVAAGVVGLMIAYWGCTLTVRLLSEKVGATGDLPTVDATTAIATVVLSLLSSAMIGLAPAARLQRTDLRGALSEGSGSRGSGRHLARLRRVLVVLQAAFAVTLLTGGGLMAKSLIELHQVGVGFDPTNKYAVIGELGFEATGDTFHQLASRIQQRVRSLPGVLNAAISNVVPTTGEYAFTFPTVEGLPDRRGGAVHLYTVSPDFFSTLGLPIVAGRSFDGMRPGDPPAAVISRVLAERLFPEENPVGKRIEMPIQGTAEIVGVVSGIYDGPRAIKTSAQCYLPYWNHTSASYNITIILQTAGRPPSGFAETVRNAIYDEDPRIVAGVAAMSDLARNTIRVERYTMGVFNAFSGASLVLIALGLFSSLSYAVAQRRPELAIRSAVGATPRRLFGMVMQNGVVLVGIGIVFGLGLAAALSRLLQAVLYETRPFEPTVYAAVVVVLLSISLLASWLPARRAAKIDPVTALRAE